MSRDPQTYVVDAIRFMTEVVDRYEQAYPEGWRNLDARALRAQINRLSSTTSIEVRMRVCRQIERRARWLMDDQHEQYRHGGAMEDLLYDVVILADTYLPVALAGEVNAFADRDLTDWTEGLEAP